MVLLLHVRLLLGAKEDPLVSCLVTALLCGAQQVEQKDWHLALTWEAAGIPADGAQEL